MLIALIGPDGCGKTTIANLKMDHLDKLEAKRVHNYEMRFGFIPTLKFYFFEIIYRVKPPNATKKGNIMLE